MNKLLPALLILFLFISCGSNNEKEIAKLNQQIIDLTVENEELKSSIDLLKYSASDRFSEITNLILENKFEEAQSKMEILEKLFPLSEQSKMCVQQREIIEEKKAQKKIEEERIKALGFKALKEETSVEVVYNKITVGNFSIGKTFAVDAYDNTWHEFTADRGNKYISARISITSTDKDPRLPAFYAYSISGDKLTLINTFMLRFARWEDYSTFLGNYNDNGNDFSKTSTIPFKIGVEVSDEATNAPLVILLKKDNCMIRLHDRFANPPVSYSASGCNSPSTTLTMQEVNDGYAVIKILNKGKL